MLGDTHTGESALRKSEEVLMTRADSGGRGWGEARIRKGPMGFSEALIGGYRGSLYIDIAILCPSLCVLYFTIRKC